MIQDDENKNVDCDTYFLQESDIQHLKTKNEVLHLHETRFAILQQTKTGIFF
jgi:hypothetical protein